MQRLPAANRAARRGAFPRAGASRSGPRGPLRVAAYATAARVKATRAARPQREDTVPRLVRAAAHEGELGAEVAADETEAIDGIGPGGAEVDGVGGEVGDGALGGSLVGLA